MKIAVFGSHLDFSEASPLFDTLGDEIISNCTFHFWDNYDDLRHELIRCEYGLVIVLANGAEGMEVCIGTRKMKPDIPLFWFSDDPFFGPQSYRLDCTYFSTKPLSSVKLTNAFDLLRKNRFVPA